MTRSSSVKELSVSNADMADVMSGITNNSGSEVALDSQAKPLSVRSTLFNFSSTTKYNGSTASGMRLLLFSI